MSETYYREVDGADDTILLLEFRVVRRTERGAWITDFWDTTGEFKRFVLDGSGKRYAYPTVEEARHSYIIRKQRQIQHAANTHDKAVRLLAIARQNTPSEPAYITLD